MSRMVHRLAGSPSVLLAHESAFLDQTVIWEQPEGGTYCIRMQGTMQRSQASPLRIDAILSQVSDTPKVATALLEALSKHIDRKTTSLRRCIHSFESKWDMNFEEFSARVHAGKMARKASRWEVETDLKAWEQAVLMLNHYTSLRTR